MGPCGLFLGSLGLTAALEENALESSWNSSLTGVIIFGCPEPLTSAPSVTDRALKDISDEADQQFPKATGCTKQPSRDSALTHG